MELILQKLIKESLLRWLETDWIHMLFNRFFGICTNMDDKSIKKIFIKTLTILVKNNYLLLFSEVLSTKNVIDYSKEKSLNTLNNYKQFEPPENFMDTGLYTLNITDRWIDLLNSKNYDEIVDKIVDKILKDSDSN